MRSHAALFTACLCYAIAFGGVAAANAVSATPQDEIERGRQLFQRRCTGCHSLDQNKEGPRLRTVYGRKAGSIPDFSYSDGMKSAGFTWDEAALNRWLINTQSVVRDNNMEFRVINAEERTAIIAFLKSQSER